MTFVFIVTMTMVSLMSSSSVRRRIPRTPLCQGGMVTMGSCVAAMVCSSRMISVSVCTMTGICCMRVRSMISCVCYWGMRSVICRSMMMISICRMIL